MCDVFRLSKAFDTVNHHILNVSVHCGTVFVLTCIWGTSTR